MPRVYKLILVGSLAALAFNAAAIIALEQLGFGETLAAVGVNLICAGAGFLAAREGGLKLAAAVGAGIGFVFATLGWAISWATLPSGPLGDPLPPWFWVFFGLMQVAGQLGIPALCAVIGGAIGPAIERRMHSPGWTLDFENRLPRNSWLNHLRKKPPSQPDHVTNGIRILWASVVLGALRVVVAPIDAGSEVQPGFGVVVGGGTIVVIGTMVWLISTGRNWARILFLILFILGLPAMVWAVVAGESILPRPWEVGFSFLQGALQLAGLLFLFTTASNVWFKQRMPIIGLALAAACVAAACGGSDNGTAPTGIASTMSVFVTSSRSTTGNLGGLRGADRICQDLARAAGLGNKLWRAYLSVERDADNGNRPTDARSRIGSGPWFNADGVRVAGNLTELHARTGDSTVFIDERGRPINGQWSGSPSPVEHDIMTGSGADGTLLAGLTCGDWTSDSPATLGQVGHSDGLGPNGNTAGASSSRNSAHSNRNCANTAPGGGAGRIYCFARN